MGKSDYKIVYILGTGHSGSTLLDMIIGGSPKAFSLGEFVFYSIYLNRRPHKKINFLTKYDCPCGEDIKDCKYWQAVHSVFREQGPIVKDRGPIDTLKIIFNLLNPLEKSFKFKVAVGKNKEVLDKAFKIAKAPCLVDSSKDPRRLYELLIDKKINKSNLFVIYLTRDGRSYINSFRKNIRLKIGQKKRNIFVSMVEWFGVNLVCQMLLSKHRPRTLRISYDYFARDPQKYLDKISEFLDIKLGTIDEALERTNKTKKHQISGNMIRFKKINAIKYDQSWKRGLNNWQKTASTALLYPFNYFWVYNKKLR